MTEARQRMMIFVADSSTSPGAFAVNLRMDDFEEKAIAKAFARELSILVSRHFGATLIGVSGGDEPSGTLQ